LGDRSLTMSYFHTGTRTIIGAEAFHCPVRDGKEWDHLAMVIRHKRLLYGGLGPRSQFAESIAGLKRSGQCLVNLIAGLIVNKWYEDRVTTHTETFSLTSSRMLFQESLWTVTVKVIGSSRTGN
jgi:hypothetical protein